MPVTLRSCVHVLDDNLRYRFLTQLREPLKESGVRGLWSERRRGDGEVIPFPVRLLMNRDRLAYHAALSHLFDHSGYCRIAVAKSYVISRVATRCLESDVDAFLNEGADDSELPVLRGDVQRSLSVNLFPIENDYELSARRGKSNVDGRLTGRWDRRRRGVEAGPIRNESLE